MADEHEKYVNGLAAIAGIAVVAVPEGPKPGGEFPKVLYHPEGARHSLHEIITHLVHDAEEEAEKLAKGWHLHPSDAVAAAADQPDPPK